MNKIFFWAPLIFTLFFFCVLQNVSAADYKLLTPFGDFTNVDTSVGSTQFSSYLQRILNIGLGGSAAISVIMLILGGIEYVFTSISEAGKKEAKDRMTNAVLGIILLLSGYLILNTINPQLISLKFPPLPDKSKLIEAEKLPPKTP